MLMRFHGSSADAHPCYSYCFQNPSENSDLNNYSLGLVQDPLHTLFFSFSLSIPCKHFRQMYFPEIESESRILTWLNWAHLKVSYALLFCVICKE